jgi:hypothetical protein
MIIYLLIIGFILFGVKEILFKHNGIESSLHWVIMAFVIGYRTFELVPRIPFHPIEILVYATIIRIIISGAIKYRKMPIAVTALSIFYVTFFVIDLLTRYNLFIVNEFKNAFLLILVFFITQHIYINKDYIIRLLKTYLFAVSAISILGILEYLFPSFMSSIFGFQNEAINNSGSIYFTRLAFLYWGSHLAANLIPPVFPILLLLKAEKDPIVNNNYILTLVIIINLIAIYLSGNRISWLILTILLFAIIFQYRSSLIPYMKTYALFITMVFVAYIYSQPVEGRYISTFKALSGNIDARYDSSGSARMGRAIIAMESIVNHPLGTGWSSQGWVHSDVLQIAATIGIVPGLLLLFAPILLLLRTFSVYFTVPPNQQTVYFSLCGVLIYIIISFCLNGNILLVQCGAPLFLFWAMADGYFRSYKQVESS